MTLLSRRPIVVGAGIAMLAVLVLLVLTVRSRYVEEASVRVPAEVSVAMLRPGRQVCVSPLISADQTDGVAIWGGPVLSDARVSVIVEGTSGSPILATGGFVASSTREYMVAVSRAIAAHRQIRVCVRAAYNAFSVLGTPPNPSIALLKRVSGLAAIAVDFTRAALFRPSWVGSWTFWLLALAFLATFGAAVAAVTRAAAEDGPEAED